MSDYKNALAKFLQSEKNAFAEPQRMLWPFRKDPYTGQMGMGHSMFTESIQNGFNFPAKVMRGEVPIFSEYEDGKTHYSPEMMQGANDTAGLAMTGAIGLSKPANSLGSGGGGKMVENALPMDQASRMGRAKDLGFDTKNVWYHGSSESGLDRLELGRRDPGAWFTTDLSNAANYARGGDAEIYKTYLRPGKSMIVEHDPNGPHAMFNPMVDGKPLDIWDNVGIVRHAMRNGYDSVHFPSGNFTESDNTMVVLRDNAIRDINASFDPAQSHSANLLAANPREGAAAAHATNVAERQANIAKGPRPEPGASQPKAEAMGGSVLAKTEDDYARFLRDVQGQVDEGIDGPFFGPPTPGVVASDVEASARRGFLNEEKYMKSGNDLYAYPVGQGLPEVGDNATIVHLAAALSEAAKASGRSLDIIGDTNYPFRSAYGQLKTPAGSSYKVRVADHSNTSSYHDAPDFNIAPGAMTPNEFMDLLPTIYANPREGAAAAMTTNTGQREENALMNVLRQYGLHY